MNRRKTVFPDVKAPLLFGHRGYSHLAPENTLAAFRLLTEQNIPGVELDVHLCRSGEVVVLHDEHLKRLADYNGLVEETDYKVLKTLDVGSHFDSRFRNERIPLLSDVFELLRDSVYYDIELKTRKKETGTLEEKVIAAIRAHGLAGRCLLSSFNPFALKACHTRGWNRTAIIYCGAGDLPFYLRNGEGRWISGCPIVKPDWKKVRYRPFYLLGSKPRYPVITWTLDDPELGKKMWQAGITGLISNNPGVHLKAREELAHDGLRTEKGGTA